MRTHDRLVNLQVGRAATQALNIYTPFAGLEIESREGTSLASQLNRIDVLVSTIVSRSGVSLGVFVGHGRSQSIENSAGGDIFGGDKDNGLALTLNFQFLK
jgi:hypothetical protein